MADDRYVVNYRWNGKRERRSGAFGFPRKPADFGRIRDIGNILAGAKSIVAHEGFTVHPDKTCILRQSQHQEVTGVVVNEKLNVDRTILHQIEKDGLAGKSWGSGDVLMAIEGFANYVAMVNPVKGH